MHDRRLTTWLKLAVLVGVLAAVYYFRFTERGREITPEYVLDNIDSHGPVTARLLYVAVYVVIYAFGLTYIYRLLRRGPAAEPEAVSQLPGRPIAAALEGSGQ